MKRYSRFIIGFIAAAITYAGLMFFIGPRHCYGRGYGHYNNSNCYGYTHHYGHHNHCGTQADSTATK